MTRKQREQVVELLRCGADRYQFGGGIGPAAVYLDATDLVWMAAIRAWDAAAEFQTPYGLHGWTYGDICLEAAARVESGDWPKKGGGV